jgi:hypothetical protein
VKRIYFQGNLEIPANSLTIPCVLTLPLHVNAARAGLLNP